MLYIVYCNHARSTNHTYIAKERLVIRIIIILIIHGYRLGTAGLPGWM